jgi:hypothetical protein
MPLDREIVEARIAVHIARLHVLAARTAVELGRARPMRTHQVPHRCSPAGPPAGSAAPPACCLPLPPEGAAKSACANFAHSDLALRRKKVSQNQWDRGEPTREEYPIFRIIA